MFIADTHVSVFDVTTIITQLRVTLTHLQMLTHATCTQVHYV